MTTGISWTDATFNGWWGCTHHGPGCAHCYAEALARRYGHDVWGPNKPRRIFGEAHWRELHKLNELAAAEGTSRRVFVGSMMDICEDREELVPIARRLVLCARRYPWLDFLLLTKRPERYPTILPADWGDGYPNVWLLASAVTQREVDLNGEALRRLPAIVRGLSLEPLLERVTTRGMPWIHWRIVGGESGARSEARFFAPEWADVVVRDADADDAAAFVKQMGTQWAYGQSLLSRKADDPAEWPAALRQQHHPLPRRSAPVAF
jgi:protein gp37